MSEELWESDAFNDKSDASVKLTKWDMWKKICPQYNELLTDYFVALIHRESSSKVTASTCGLCLTIEDDEFFVP